MFQTIRNALAIPETRKKLLYTLMIIVLFRIGAAIPVPFLDPSALKAMVESSGDFLGYFDIMTGGSFANATLFAMSITPYINASIIVQLLTVAIRPLERMAKEGETGRKKLAKITRYVTFGIALLMAIAYYFLARSSGALTETYMVGKTGFFVACVIVVTFVAGTAVIVWLGERINEKGIGNGISMIIFCGIVSAIPQQIVGAFEQYLQSNLTTGDSIMILKGVLSLLTYFLAFFAIIVFVVFVEKSERRLPVSHSNTSESQTKELNQKASFLPIKINSSGVIPVIFASSVMIAPSIIISLFIGSDNQPYWVTVLNEVFSYNTLVEMPGINGTKWYMPWGLIIYLVLIILFSYFYANLQINPERIAENFQESGTYITGLRPGVETERYIKTVLNRVTFMGSIALALIAALPVVLTLTGVVPSSLALGGTGMIIVVGVCLELRNQVEGMIATKSFEKMSL